MFFLSSAWLRATGFPCCWAFQKWWLGLPNLKKYKYADSLQFQGWAGINRHASSALRMLKILPLCRFSTVQSFSTQDTRPKEAEQRSVLAPIVSYRSNSKSGIETVGTWLYNEQYNEHLCIRDENKPWKIFVPDICKIYNLGQNASTKLWSNFVWKHVSGSQAQSSSLISRHGSWLAWPGETWLFDQRSATRRGSGHRSGGSRLVARDCVGLAGKPANIIPWRNSLKKVAHLEFFTNLRWKKKCFW